LPLEAKKARLYYANDAITRNLGIRELRNQISRKAYERREIANSQFKGTSKISFNIFKDPYILGFGHGFTFVKRQKPMLTFFNSIFILM
jgi:predicted nuclease of restriction endonuclease-like (RecB) superfamily